MGDQEVQFGKHPAENPPVEFGKQAGSDATTYSVPGDNAPTHDDADDVPDDDDDAEDATTDDDAEE